MATGAEWFNLGKEHTMDTREGYLRKFSCVFSLFNMVVET